MPSSSEHTSSVSANSGSSEKSGKAAGAPEAEKPAKTSCPIWNAKEGKGGNARVEEEKKVERKRKKNGNVGMGLKEEEDERDGEEGEGHGIGQAEQNGNLNLSQCDTLKKMRSKKKEEGIPHISESVASTAELKMSMDEVGCTSHISPSSKKIMWSKEMERKFLDLLLEQVQLGKKCDGGFKKEAWSAIERRFNSEMNLNLSKDKFKNKLKTWKLAYRAMKELRNTSGFAWNEATQCMDAEDSVWDELLKRREFKNAKVYKRQPFQYFNELGAIVGNDIAEGNAATTAIEAEEGNPMEEPFNVNDEDDISFSIHLDSAADLDEDPCPSYQSTGTPSARGTPTPSVRRLGKRRKASMAASLDAMCETMKKIKEGMSNVHLHKIDQSDNDNALTGAYTALKSIPKLSRGVFLRVYDTFVVERERAKGFLLMTEDERVDWIAATYGGL